MSEYGHEACSAAGTAALHGPDGHIEDPGRLGNRIALHVHQDERGALLGGQGRQSLEKLAVKVAALGRRGGRFMGFEEQLESLGLADGRGPSDSGLARPVQAGVDRDAMQPGGDRGPALEGVRGPVSGDQGILDRVGGLLPVSESAQRHRPQSVAVAPYDLAECFRVAFEMADEEILVARGVAHGVVQRRPLPSAPDEMDQPVNVTSVMACLYPALV
jgi:hypothetical protein